MKLHLYLIGRYANGYEWELSRVLDAVMSSYDSLDIVFRCLTKGAADYLVKPVRKNELRNLWQHVWRKCHSVSARSDFVRLGFESTGLCTQQDRSEW